MNKQQILNALTIAGAFMVVFSIGAMIAPGLSGDSTKVKVYFALMVAGLLTSVPSVIAQKYIQNNHDVARDRMHIEVSTLASVGKHASSSDRRKDKH